MSRRRLAKLPGCKEQPAPPLFSPSACCVDEMHEQHPEQFLPGSGTVVQDCRDVVYTAGRAAKSFFGVGTVCVVPLSLLLEKYSALAGRAGTDITRQKPARIPMRGEG